MEKTLSKKSIVITFSLLMLVFLASIIFTGCVATTYTVNFAVNDATYGSVSQTKLEKVEADSVVIINNNKLTIGETEITATPAAATSSYTYTFSGWSVANGDKITKDTTITATFTRTAVELNYTVAEVKSALNTIATNASVGNLKNVSSILYNKITTYTENTAFTIIDDVTAPSLEESVIINTNLTTKTIEITIKQDDMQYAGDASWQAVYSKIYITLDDNKAVVTATYDCFITANNSLITYGIYFINEAYSSITEATTTSQPNLYTQNYITAGNAGEAMSTVAETEYNRIVALYA